MGDISIPREPRPTSSPLIHNLTIVASGLTAASIAVNLMLQVAHFLRKRPMEPDQRDRVEAAGLTHVGVGRGRPAAARKGRAG